MLEPFQLIQGAVALLAFIMAFYALVTRERKTPYSAATVYHSVYLSATAVVFALIAKALDTPTLEAWSHGTLLMGHLALVGGLVAFVVRVGRMHNRDRNLRDDSYFKNTTFWRWSKSKTKTKDDDYDHAASGLPETLLEEIAATGVAPKEALVAAYKRNSEFGSLSIVLKADDRQHARAIVEALASKFLANDFGVQFTSALRHPAEFVFALRDSWSHPSKSWNAVSRRLVVVDAHTPHFGFIDSIHAKYTERTGPLVNGFITSAPTFAGIHTAAAQAYNLIKQKDGPKGSRPPTLVIYEGLHTLTDLESAEQYRVFCRHVLPSEKLWGAMLTVFVESSVDPANLAALRDHADIVTVVGLLAEVAAPNQGTPLLSVVPRDPVPSPRPNEPSTTTPSSSEVKS